MYSVTCFRPQPGPIDDQMMEQLRCACAEVWSYEQFSFVIDVLIVCPMSIVGFVGNCLSVIVLRTDSAINYATSLMLGAIAVIDNIYLVSCLLYQTTKAICHYDRTESTTDGQNGTSHTSWS